MARSIFGSLYIHDDGRFEVLIRKDELKRLLKANKALGSAAPFKRFLPKSCQSRPLSECEFVDLADLPGLVDQLAKIYVNIDVAETNLAEKQGNAHAAPTSKVFIAAKGVADNGILVSTVDVMGFLPHINIIPSTFESSVDVLLNARHGTITVPAGSILNKIDPQSPEDTGFVIAVSYCYE
jgi:hypothetical protein